ncbi:MAG: tRNA (adenosine(37)-N6)-dimethylallyltransferase MiaA [Candidatus Melainabacteria bacterium]|nr:tRNA (adenosine(37)-N6)-dimethylallyltransferase MiaA [Candidatus Melainabacteria bacterium]
MTEIDSKPNVIAVVGPTASGKTALALQLAAKFGGEVIACDSRTVYQYMDIGTAKPSREEQNEIPHHMLDVVEPDRVYSVAEFQREGTVALQSILSRGKLPIVCGGTGLYARALLEGLMIPEVAPQPELRESLKVLADEHGNEAIFSKLKELDPVSAGKIAANDRFRIIRALEVTMTLGRPFSEVTGKTEVPFNVIWIGLNFDDRSILRNRIIERWDMQIKAGMIDETRLLVSKYGLTQPILNAVGYKQLITYTDGLWSLEEATEDCIRHSYQLARKQIMWFRSNPATNWFSVDKSKHLFDDVLTQLDGRIETP